MSSTLPFKPYTLSLKAKEWEYRIHAAEILVERHPENVNAALFLYHCESQLDALEQAHADVLTTRVQSE